MFGAQLHFTGAGESAWGELEIAREALTEELADEGAAPFTIPIGGSTPVGALGYVAAFDELLQPMRRARRRPGGDRAHVVERRHPCRARRRTGAGARRRASRCPRCSRSASPRASISGCPTSSGLAGDTLELIGEPRTLVADDDVHIDTGWIGEDYAIPTEQGDAAIRWAARHGGWVLDRVYSGKGMAGLLGNAAAGRWPAGSDVVFIHTGGVSRRSSPLVGVPASALA